jgi:thiol:disulfide interchange protein DsbC
MRSQALWAMSVAGVLVAAGALAETESPPDALTEQLERMAAQLGGGAIAETPLPGIYEVHFGPSVVYMSGDGRYALQGDLIDLEAGENLTDRARRMALSESMAGLDESTLIIFAAAEPIGSATVFTDVDCGYCRRLHDEVPELNSMGITIRYAAFPRAGLAGATFETMTSVWCAADQQGAMTAAKAGRAVARAECATPIADHHGLGQRAGVRGTPAIVLDDGTLVPGYVPAARLRDLVKEHAPQ